MEQFNQSPESASQKRLPKIRISKRFVILGSALSLILIGCFGYAMYKTEPAEPKLVTNQCSNEQQAKMLQDIYTALQKPNKQELKPYVDKITKIPGYQQDATCLYPIALYQIATGNTAEAQKTVAQLQVAYSPEVGYSPFYGTDTQNPEVLNSQVEVMVEQQKLNETQFDVFGQGAAE